MGRADYRVAIDLGAGSGRAMLGGVADGHLVLREAHRFHYAPRRRDGHLRWDFGRLLEGVDASLQAAAAIARSEGGRVASVGVESWGVDYGLVDSGGRLLEDPIAYRDERTRGVMEQVQARIPREELFARTGIQFLPFNTLYQLAAHVQEGLPEGAHELLMIPDLCHLHLCGVRRGEITNASTTQMWHLERGGWDTELLERIGLPAALLPEVVPAGTTLGLLCSSRRGASPPGTAVIAPATHDTGSAVAGTPLNDGWAYISSGTWSLVGVERTTPVLSREAARESFTNEAGVGGSVRFLKNVMGLWILDSCRKEWGTLDAASLGELLRDAGRQRFQGVVFPDDERFFNPESMTGALRAHLEESGQPAPEAPAALTRIILDSLALRYASILETLERLTGAPIPGIHVVGGGSLNEYLNRATADASGRPVVAGPVEATAAGNLIVQLLGAGEIDSLAEGRRLAAGSAQTRRYEPSGAEEWAEARERYREVESRRL
jgi:rhamnulokinase